MSGLTFQVTGIKETVKVLSRVGTLPQRTVSRAAGKGATVIKKAVRGQVPVGDTGNLKRSIIRHGEHSRSRGKKVFDIYFDPSMNDVLQKPVKQPGAAGSKTTKNGHAYYPASMEFGFLTRSKGKGLTYVPGYHFMRDSADGSSAAAKQAIINDLSKEIDKEWNSR